jgi:hypothetical protein
MVNQKEDASFAKKSLDALIDLEERGGAIKFTLGLFCYLYIGVLNSGYHKFHYFVNGVSRTPRADLKFTGHNSELSDTRKPVFRVFVEHLAFSMLRFQGETMRRSVLDLLQEPWRRRMEKNVTSKSHTVLCITK